jgi:hypothetical protein
MSEEYQDGYNKRLKENVFLAMELGKMSYSEVLAMPVNRLEEFLDWKIRYDNEKEKAKANSLEQITL